MPIRVQSDGAFLTTQAMAAITTSSPIVSGPMMLAFAPTLTLSPNTKDFGGWSICLPSDKLLMRHEPGQVGG